MNLTIDASEVTAIAARLRDFPHRMRKTAAIALTRTMVQVQEAERAEMRDVFDRPTPYTVGGQGNSRDALFLRPATPELLEAQVGVKHSIGSSGRPAIRWLKWHIYGGNRTPKAFERLLLSIGAMRAGDVSVPGKFAKLDAFGNVSRGQITQILSQLRVDTYTGSSRSLPRVAAEDNAKTKRYKQNVIRRAYGRAGGQYVAFQDGRGKLPPGVYLMEGRNFGAKWGFGRSGSVKPVLIFVPRARYEAGRFDFHYVAELGIRRHLAREMKRAVDDALAYMAANQGARR